VVGIFSPELRGNDASQERKESKGSFSKYKGNDKVGASPKASYSCCSASITQEINKGDSGNISHKPV